MTYVEIPTWVFCMLVFWCISYIAVIAYIMSSFNKRTNDIWVEYSSHKLALDDRIDAANEKLSKYKRDNDDYIANAVLFELSRHEEFIAKHEMKLPDMEARMNSMEKAFELLRKECMAQGEVLKESTDGSKMLESEKSAGGTDEKEAEND